MIYLALTILSGLFLTALAASLLYGVYIVVGLVVLGSWELVKFTCRELKKELQEDWKTVKKVYFNK